MDGDPFFCSTAKVAKSAKLRAEKTNDDRAKRRANGRSAANATRGKQPKRTVPSLDEHIIDDDGPLLDNEVDDATMYSESEEEEVQETAAEKRLRMAKELVARLEAEEAELAEDEELSGDMVAQRLRENMQEQRGVLRRNLAENLFGHVIADDGIITTAGHRLPLTCVALASDGDTFATGSKDGCLIKWNRHAGLKLHHWKRKSKSAPFQPGHVGAVLCVTISSDQQYMASGGADGLVHVWNYASGEHVKAFRGHRGPINGLVFRLSSLQLFSASDDRTVKVWSLSEMTYVETLYGHQEGVLAIDALHRERAVSCGGRDNSLRLWKIVEESQLVYTAKVGVSMDCLAMLSEIHYVSGDQSGSLLLWDMNRKKPCYVLRNAHGEDSWICSIATVPYSDLVASGGSDGTIRLWQIVDKLKGLKLVMTLEAPGYVNGLKFAADGSLLVAALGKEHRLGRWDVLGSARNQCRVFNLTQLKAANGQAGHDKNDSDDKQDEDDS
eukprot:TRINITY_DN7770_c0_g1_i2.p1 TRINITY_DN7770_c0_g1~~TRINITY_DN7770_c0_g1_i2.p1  ORF type:complete len:498 (+),score=92.46 TRINITY_DN7770_c0_g1_i2:96-1589(+)